MTINDSIWRGVEPVLRDFRDKVSQKFENPPRTSIIVEKSEYVPLNMYLSFVVGASGEEIVVGITGFTKGNHLVVGSDIIGPAGREIAEGPNAAIPIDSASEATLSSIEEFSRDLDLFLLENFEAVFAIILSES